MQALIKIDYSRGDFNTYRSVMVQFERAGVPTYLEEIFCSYEPIPDFKRAIEFCRDRGLYYAIDDSVTYFLNEANSPYFLVEDDNGLKMVTR